MKPARKDWIARNNESWGAGLKIMFDDGSPFDWTQYSAIEMQVKVDPLQPEPEFSLTLGSGLTVDSEDHSWLDINVAADDVKDLLGVYVYDIVGTNSGDLTTVAYGSITVNQGITR